MPSPHRRSRRAGLAALAGLLLSVLVTVPAGALRTDPNAPTTSTTAPAAGTAAAPTGPTATTAAATVSGDDLSAQHLEAVAEQYNLARLKVERASAAIVETERRIDAAQQRVDLVKARVRARAAAIYRNAGATTVNLPIPSAASFADRTRRHAYLDAAQNPDRDLIEQLSTQLQRLATERDAARTAREQLQREADDAARIKRRLNDLAARAAAASRAAAARTGDGAGPTGAPASTTGTGAYAGGTTTTTRPGSPPTTRPASPPPTTPSNPPPTGGGGGPAPPVSGGAATAVAFARAQLGKPYVFATSGPNSFDCSGLTMAAWAAAGVRMPHYSGSQATMFPKVSWEQLQPGDIVVFYSDLHHVGLYIGGGMMIHAPQTGDVVKIAPAWRTTFMWGVRPG